MHKSVVNGHKRAMKTYKRVRQDYLWPNMKKDVQNMISNSKLCQINKLVRLKVKQQMIVTDTPGQSFDKVAMDLFGPLPKLSCECAFVL